MVTRKSTLRKAQIVIGLLFFVFSLNRAFAQQGTTTYGLIAYTGNGELQYNLTKYGPYYCGASYFEGWRADQFSYKPNNSNAWQSQTGGQTSAIYVYGNPPGACGSSASNNSGTILLNFVSVAVHFTLGYGGSVSVY